MHNARVWRLRRHRRAEAKFFDGVDDSWKEACQTVAPQYILMTVASQPGHNDFQPSPFLLAPPPFFFRRVVCAHTLFPLLRAFSPPTVGPLVPLFFSARVYTIFPSSVSSIIGQNFMHILFKPRGWSSRGKKNQDINLTVYPLGSRNRYILIRRAGSIVSSIGIFVSLVVVVVNEARITILVTSQFVIPWMKFDFVLFSIRYPTPTCILFNSRIRGAARRTMYEAFSLHKWENDSFVHAARLPINRPLPYLLSSPFFLSFPHSRGWLRAHRHRSSPRFGHFYRSIWPPRSPIHFSKNRFPLQLLRFSNQLFGRIIATTGL